MLSVDGKPLSVSLVHRYLDMSDSQKVAPFGCRSMKGLGRIGGDYLSFLSSRFASAIASGSNSSAERLR